MEPGSPSSRPLPAPSYVTTILGNGTVCPISEIRGRRRVRRIDPGSAEGKRLLRQGQVVILARDGTRFSGVPIDEVLARLARQADRQAHAPETDPRGLDTIAGLLEVLERQRRSYS